MSSNSVAGVDWAGDGWLAVVIADGSYRESFLETNFESIWGAGDAFEYVLIDVPIGLPDGPETLQIREELDSKARSITGRPSSVFPVPSRDAAKKAYKEKSYEEVASQNEDDLEKGLNRQSYYISSGIGDVDRFLLENKQLKDVIIESHPELCFRALAGEELQHSKKSASGIGERLVALRRLLDKPGSVFERILEDMVGYSDIVEVDDVIDALVLGAVAQVGRDNLHYIPEKDITDSEKLPMRMAYWAEEPVFDS